MEKIELYKSLLTEVVDLAMMECERIKAGDKSAWRLSLLENVVLPEMGELLSHAEEGEYFFKWEKQRLLETTYYMTDSFERLSETPLGKKIHEFQTLYFTL